MAEANPSTLAFRQLGEKLENLTNRLKADYARQLPVDALYMEVQTAFTELDQLMESQKGAPIYAEYQKIRKITRALPIIPGADFSRQ